MTQTMTKRVAREAGMAGLPEPRPITKHVREYDPISGLWGEGDVETDSSMQIRAAWRKGRNIYECRLHVQELQKRNEQIS